MYKSASVYIWLIEYDWMEDESRSIWVNVLSYIPPLPPSLALTRGAAPTLLWYRCWEKSGGGSAADINTVRGAASSSEVSPPSSLLLAWVIVTLWLRPPAPGFVPSPAPPFAPHWSTPPPLPSSSSPPSLPFLFLHPGPDGVCVLKSTRGRDGDAETEAHAAWRGREGARGRTPLLPPLFLSSAGGQDVRSSEDWRTTWLSACLSVWLSVCLPACWGNWSAGGSAPVSCCSS